MSRIRANQITNKGANGAPNFPNGLTVTGIVTASVSASTIGTLAVTGNATIDGNLGVGGTITYEDVARVDATGISTFREGFKVGPLSGIGLTAYKDGSIRSSGIITATTYYGSGSNLTGIDATQIVTGNTSVQTVDTGSDGHVKVTTEGTERLRVDNAGRVGINTITMSTANAGFDDLVIGAAASGNTGITLLSGATTQGTLAFADGGSSTEPYRGYVQYSHNGDTLILGAGGADRIRIGSSGEIGVAGGGSLNNGTAGQFLRSGGNSAGCQWADGAKIVKVYQGSTSSSTSINSTSYADIGLAETLTPLSSSNTFLIQFNMGVMRKTQGTTSSVYTRLIVPGGNVTWGSGYQLYYHGTDNNTDRGEPPAFWQFIHAPSTTSSIEYKVQWRSEAVNGSGFLLYGHRQMIIYELSGGVNT